MQKYIGCKKEIYACFIDYAKAFDRVQHSEMMRILEKIGIDGKDIRIIAHLYWHKKAAIRSGCDISPFTSIKRGVRQGCVLSPYLFNIYTEFIFRKTSNFPGLNIGGKKFNNIRYADDTVLLTENSEALQLLAEAVNKNSNDAGLEMNVKKTKTMVITKFPPSSKATSIKIKGEEIEQVDSFKYLGQEVNDSNKQGEELKKRINLAKLKFVEMKSIFTSKEIKLRNKLRLVNCYIYSILLYGADTRTLPQSKLNKIEAFEMWIYRRLAKISWKDKKTNQEVCDDLGTKREIAKTIKTRKIKYFGHIKRHTSFLKDVLEGKIEGSRPSGRQRRQWVDDIAEWTGKGIRQCSVEAQHRDKWRSVSSQLLEQGRYRE
ncbi:endonuclease-reverse transcriptase [Elysia marginata]|uniref:Endonuclease-reverse transcriptase n=1 Tax=Elysia marginata TaxID=1093978 RepID=A0AAV4G8R8_9GAST|nr:endonuclease-reverse transcriptase [Elysia marginata]